MSKPNASYHDEDTVLTKADLGTISPATSPTGRGEEVHEHISKLQIVRARLGLQPEAPTHSTHDAPITELRLWVPQARFVLREPLAEFFGVLVMILFGCGSVAQVLLSTGKTSAPGGDGWGSYQSINWG